MLIWLIISCISPIRSQYEERSIDILAPASAMHEDWQPDLRIRISHDAIEQISERAIDKGLLSQKGREINWSPRIGPDLTLKPKMTVSRIRVQEQTSSCNCFDIHLKLKGSTAWALGRRSGDLDLKANGKVRLFLEFTRNETNQWTVSMGDLDIQRVSLELGALPDVDLSKLLQPWVERSIQATPEIFLGELGGEQLPIRALRLGSTTDNAIQIEARSDIRGGGQLPNSTAPIHHDWGVQISQETITAMLRIEAFKVGIMPMGFALDPKQLDFSNDAFSLSIRLWRLIRWGWWRDYDVQGQFFLKDHQFVIEAQSVENTDRSRFAGLVDPIAMLAERKLLATIEDGVQQAIPLNQNARFKDIRLGSIAKTVSASNGVLAVEGSLSIQAND